MSIYNPALYAYNLVIWIDMGLKYFPSCFCCEMYICFPLPLSTSPGAVTL